MKFIHNFFLLLIIVLAFSCSKKEENKLIIKEKDLELQMIDSYKQGVKALDIGDGITAARKFNEAELLFPQSEWAPKSALMAAYSYYVIDNYEDAINEIELYLKKYPKDERVAYANFLLAMSYYQSIVDEKKDLKPLLKAKEQFIYVAQTYPNTDFALDAKFKIDLIKEILASKEMYLGNYYIQKKKWIAAINRYKNVINEYETTIFVEEALHRLVELHYKIGLVNEAKKYAQLLGYNYLSSDWYKSTYKIFNKDYKLAKPKDRKKESSYLIKKYNSIFKRK
jgi:outer membrane protein assembly factor BamD|tara:strand:+ start:1506 stop:2351 length:846 start_codon:yes stop_codon:yes gene_type:complete